MFQQLRQRLTQRDDDGLSLARAIAQGLLFSAAFILAPGAMLEVLRRAAE
jgi:hypothetical protein